MGWLILLALVLIFPKVVIGIFAFFVGILLVVVLGITYVIVSILESIANLIR